MSGEQRETIVQRVLESGGKHAEVGWSFKSHWNAFKTAWNWSTQVEDAQEELKRALKDASKAPDPEFIASLTTLATEPLFTEAAETLLNQWRQIMRDRSDTMIRVVSNKISHIQQTTLSKRASEMHKSELGTAVLTARRALFQALAVVTSQGGHLG